MKRFNLILLLCMVCYSISAYAELQNDVLIMRDGTQIACVITEMTDDNVKYHRTDRPATILYTTPISSISKIVYQNGAVDDFESQTLSVQAENKNVALHENEPTQNEPKEPQEEVKPTYAQSVRTVTLAQETDQSRNTTANMPPQQIMRSGNSYYYNGQMMKGGVFNGNYYERFLRENCQPAYEKFHTGSVVAAVGWGLFIGGLILDVGFSWWVPYTGYVALPCEIASIHMLIVGYCQMHRSAEIFNMTNSRRNDRYWSLNASQNGIGLAFNF